MFRYIAEMLGPVYAPLRHPFKTFQKFLGIQEEWMQAKAVLRPHRYKLLFLTGIATYPLYQHWLVEAKISALAWG